LLQWLLFKWLCPASTGRVQDQPVGGGHVLVIGRVEQFVHGASVGQREQ
jgi:hypothetical protein